jgi:hypothetical protein
VGGNLDWIPGSVSSISRQISPGVLADDELAITCSEALIIRAHNMHASVVVYAYSSVSHTLARALCPCVLEKGGVPAGRAS